MITVNPVYINYLLIPLIGGADNEEEIIKFSKFDLNNKEDVEALSKEYLLKEFYQQRVELQREVQNALAYYLINDKLDFESHLDSLLLATRTPENSKLFFKLIWQNFFGNENPEEVINNHVVVEDFDVNAPFKLLINLNN